MLSFKRFLVLENIAQDSEANGDVLYPSTAGDYMYAVSDPTEFWWLKWRWKNEKKQGRKFHNINDKSVQSTSFVALQSTEMPNADDSFWKNGKDKKSSQKVQSVKTLSLLKIGKNSKDRQMDDDPYFSYDGNLKHHFGDDHSGKWPEEAPDTDWTKP